MKMLKKKGCATIKGLKERLESEMNLLLSKSQERILIHLSKDPKNETWFAASTFAEVCIKFSFISVFLISSLKRILEDSKETRKSLEIESSNKN